MFIPSEDLQRNKSFDELIANTHAALSNPTVAALLGGLTGRLLAINARAFLPNIRHGIVEVPSEYRDIYDVCAVLPLTDEEAAESEKAIEPLVNDFGPRIELWGVSYFRGQGTVVNTRDTLQKLFTGEPQDHGHGPTGRTGARTRTGYDVDNDLQWYSMSRSIEVVRRSKLGKGVLQAVAMAHEHVHVHDAAEMGPFYNLAEGGASSELLAYHVGATIYDHACTLEGGAGSMSRWVERLRQVHTSADAPFTPTPELMAIMTENGITY